MEQSEVTSEQVEAYFRARFEPAIEKRMKGSSAGAKAMATLKLIQYSRELLEP